MNEDALVSASFSIQLLGFLKIKYLKVKYSALASIGVHSQLIYP